MLVVLVTGSRDWEDLETLETVLRALPKGTQLIHGGALGADVATTLLADAVGLPKPLVVRPEYDYWKEKIGPRAGGKVAPLKRNELMLDGKQTEEGESDPRLIPSFVIAFFMTDKETGGTARCVKEARKRGIPVVKFQADQLMVDTSEILQLVDSPKPQESGQIPGHDQ